MRPLSLIIALLVTSQARAQAGADRSSVRTLSSVAPEMDYCLDHGVRELGMSAKREGEARVWKIGPQFLHPSLGPQGTVRLEFTKAADRARIQVDATWPGPLKAREVQTEIEARLRAMAEKLAQLCGVTRPEVQCSATPAGGSASACAPPQG